MPFAVDRPDMAITSGVQSVDLSQRVGFVVRLEGTEWTTTEVVRTLQGIGGLELLEVRTSETAEELAIAGRPVAVAAAVRVLAVDPGDRIRVLSRLHSDYGINLVG